MINHNPTKYDWIEDFDHENGYYQHTCKECGITFYGHKRGRIWCKKCGWWVSTPALQMIFELFDYYEALKLYSFKRDNNKEVWVLENYDIGGYGYIKIDEISEGCDSLEVIREAYAQMKFEKNYD